MIAAEVYGGLYESEAPSREESYLRAPTTASTASKTG